MNSIAALTTFDLTDCDREPIHHIGSVQPIGFLIAVNDDWVISRFSANTAKHLDLPLKGLLGVSLAGILRTDAVHTIRNRLSILSGLDSVERAFAVQLRPNGPLYDLAIHRSDAVIVIEAEPNIPASDIYAGNMVRSMLARLDGQKNMVAEAVRLVYALTGFDRVMIYHFHPDGSGEVIAERARPGLEPFLGLRYPAEDIPRQARALLVRNRVRILVDVDAEPSPLIPAPDGFNEPLDLSMSTLRTHSKMCIEFLKNMGVGATMTVSLVRDGKLWGLISCHHMTARHVGYEQRTTAELFGQMLSYMLDERERSDVAAYDGHTQALRQQLIAAVVERGSAHESIAQLADRMTELTPCDGVAIYIDGRLTLRGDTPSLDECIALRSFLDRNAAGQIYATEYLGKVYPPARAFVDRAAGILVLPISLEPRDYLVFFRHEQSHSVNWAGRPGKIEVFGPNGSRLTPRKSFEAWRETVRGQSVAWTPAELSAAEIMRVTLLEMVLRLVDKTGMENLVVSQKQELLIAELNHRVRNILSLIRGLVTQSRVSAEDVDTFATVLGDRVHALARAHDQITAKNWGPGSLRSLIAVETSAFLGNGAARVTYHGPDMLLQPQAFSTIALVIHELVTNAAKHGALSGDTGQVALTWDADSNKDLTLHWSETGGAPVSAPVRRGFGSTIIERSVPHELGGQAMVDYCERGLQARFVIPGRHVVPGSDALTPQTDATTPLEDRVSASLTGTVLLVEDNIIIALEAENMLLALGATNVLIASSVAEAFTLLTATTPSFALLDINLGAETSWPIATHLRERGVRYIFCTGYGDGIDYPLEHRSAPSITKPYTIDSIARTLVGWVRPGKGTSCDIGIPITYCHI
jgi:light-regulated signal transduction histidine kinase (bacteriophytochrome)/CheY-like chemotaxis protein